ncbi:MAG: CotH kinase family protein [Anaerolineaceae bacterium]|nr:CotH kinase family protein [Anaerolineaceae bacterium]
MSAAHRFLSIFVLLITLTGCAPRAQSMPLYSSGTEGTNSSEETTRASNWNEATHGNASEPDYATVFPQDSVNRIDITLTEEAWTALQTEMEEQFGEFGTGNRQGDFNNRQPGQNPPEGWEPPTGQQPPTGDQQPQEGNPRGQMPEGQATRQAPGNFPQGGMPGGGMGRMDLGETTYVESTIAFNSETWENVGFRYSGNSTLRTSWSNGTHKISFRLDFDEFEGSYPSIEDQRFYGFKQLSFKSNAMDDSYLREKVAADVFRDAGVVSSQTAFYEVYIDYGEGPQYFGLYTAVEIVDDTVIETQFEDDSGNVYKPEGTGAAFAEGTFNEESFEKQTNEDEADWSDIQAVFAALHTVERTSDPEAWRAGLESVFDVDAFIRWLAVDTIIQNWDTYGAMAHNYYLYTDPADGLVTWIPWDNNMSFSAASGPGGGDRGGGGGRMGNVRELDMETINDQWPLIRYLIDDPIYNAKYQQYLEETIEDTFEPEKMAATYQKYHDLIAPFVEKEEQGFTQINSMKAFEASLDELTLHAQSRAEAVEEYLAGQ